MTRDAARQHAATRAGWAYLAVSVNGLAYTLNAFRPPRRNRLLLGWGFLASWITIELAPFHLVWQILMTGMFAGRGALRTRPGRIGLGITIASWIGLALTVRQSFAARHEVRDAMRDLEPDERAEVRLAVRVDKGVAFGRAGGRTLRLDVHRPDEAAAPGSRRPALVQVHGGGWVLGFKDRQGQLLMRELSARGWVCFNVDYRLSPAATFPDHLVDVKRAIAWVRDHADDYGIDPDFVAVSGGSAGGHLTALAALTPDDPRYQPGFESADTSVQAAVPFYGVYDFANRSGVAPADLERILLRRLVMKADLDEARDAYLAASPLDQVRADAPPFFVIHGDRDVLAPVEDARAFVARLRAVSRQPVYYLELKGAQHAFETFASIRSNVVVEAAARFLDAVWAAHRHGPEAEATPHEVRTEVGEEFGAELTEALD